MRVLLADPDGVLSKIIQSYLCRFGYEVEIAIDRMECISALTQFAPDAVVIDQDLAWDGCEGVLKWMAEELRLFNIAIILTGETSDSNEFLAHRRLLFDCLAKPYGLGDLLKHLDGAIGTKSKLLAATEAV